MKREQFSALLENFSASLKARGFDVVGCSEEQLQRLETRYGRLPALYRIFLQCLGISAGDFKAGTWIFYEHIADINEETALLMRQNGVIPPEDFFAFLMHQGYTSLFFCNRSADDPMVYCYTEGRPIDAIKKCFSACIEDEIKEYLSLHA